MLKHRFLQGHSWGLFHGNGGCGFFQQRAYVHNQNSRLLAGLIISGYATCLGFDFFFLSVFFVIVM